MAPAEETKRQQQQLTGKQIPQWREAVAGACAGMLSRTIMAPLERLKLLKQLQTTQAELQNQSTLKILYKVYQEQGLYSFWRGNLPAALRVAGTASINFTCLEYYKRTFVGPLFLKSSHGNGRDDDDDERYKRFLTSLVAGGLAGATSTTIMYPFEFARTRLALDMGKDGKPSTTKNNNTSSHVSKATISRRQYQGMVDVVAQILRSDGPLGLYQGYGIALVGGIFYRVLYLGGYDALKSEIQHQRQGPHDDSNRSAAGLSWAERFVAAQVISLTAGTLSYPFDSVRRRMMMQSGTTQQKYRNSWHCMVQMWRYEGMRGFFLGLGPNILRSVGGTLLLVAYDAVRTLL